MEVKLRKKKGDSRRVRWQAQPLICGSEYGNNSSVDREEKLALCDCMTFLSISSVSNRHSTVDLADTPECVELGIPAEMQGPRLEEGPPSEHESAMEEGIEQDENDYAEVIAAIATEMATAGGRVTALSSLPSSDSNTGLRGLEQMMERTAR